MTAAWQDVMGTSPDDLPLLDAPPAGVLKGGRELLRDLGAIDAAGRITPLGKRMAGLGTHPRLAAMLCAAKTIPERVTAACLAALLEERDPLRPRPNTPVGASAGADIRTRLALFERDDPRADRASLFHMRQSAKRFLRRMGGKDLPLSPMPAHAGPLLAAGFPDRVAQAAGELGRFRLAGGGSARVSANDGLAREKLLAAAAFHTRTSTEITLAAPLDAENLPQMLLDRTTEQVETSLDGASGRIIARRRLRLGALILRDRNTEVTPEEAQALLLQQIQSDLPRVLDWSDATRQFQARVAHARTAYAPHLPDLSLEALAQNLEWLEPYLAGCDRLTQVKALDLLSILRAQLDYADLSALDRKLPPRLTLKASTHEIDYTGAIPTVSARAQAFYGTASTPVLADGQVALQCALLSPAVVRRRLQLIWQASGKEAGWICVRTCAAVTLGMTGLKIRPRLSHRSLGRSVSPVAEWRCGKGSEHLPHSRPYRPERKGDDPSRPADRRVHQLSGWILPKRRFPLRPGPPLSVF